MKKRFAVLAIALVSAFAVGVADASAIGRWVNDTGTPVPPGTSCSNPGYSTIQDAVMASVAGDTINVCPGTYPEQVTVETAAKSNITLRSVVPLAARIEPPSPLLMEVFHGDLVRIDQGARNVTIRGFTIAGPLPDTLFCALQLRSGVRVKGGSSAVIVNNYITEMWAANPLLRGCQNGFAITVGRTFDVPVPGQVGQAVIVGNRIDKYQKGGIYADNAGTHVTVRNNDLTGMGPNSVIAQNAIQISRNATADVQENWIRDHSYFSPVFPCTLQPGSCVTATAILLYQLPGGVTVEENQLRRNQDGVVLWTASHLRIAHNTIIGDVPGFGSGIPGREWGDGIYAEDDTFENVIIGNFLRDNIEHDCHDNSVGPYNPPALVANPWIRNDGVTRNREGLCEGARGDDDDDSEDDEDGSDDDSHGHGDPDSSDDSDDSDD